MKRVVSVLCVLMMVFGMFAITAQAATTVSITAQPKSVTVANGAVAKVSFTAVGDGLTYTWYFKNKGASSFSKTTSFTGNTYSVQMDASRDGRQVYCVVKDRYGNYAKTTTATISMGNVATITKQPSSVTVPNGITAKVKFKASGDGLTYTWYFKNKGDSSFSKTTSFTGNFYSVKMDASRNGRQIYCVVKDKYGNYVKTKTVTLTMGNPATITSQPSSVAVADGLTAKVKFKATGDGLTYTWYFKNPGSSTFYKTNSFVSNFYSVKMDASRDGRQVYCVVTDKYGNSVKTDTVTLSVAKPGQITKQPVNAVAPNGAAAKVSLTASGDGLTYIWYFKNKGETAFAKTTSFTGNTYSVKMDASRNGRQVYCVVKDLYGNYLKSKTVTLIMGNPATITKQPTDVTAMAGDTAKVSFKATGDGLTYTWYFKNKGGSSFSKTTSFTGNTYSVQMDASRDGRQVYCVVKDQYGNYVKTKTVTLKMYKELTISSQPVDTYGRVEEYVSFSTKVTGGTAPYTYQWYFYCLSNDEWVACEEGDWFIGTTTPTLTTRVSIDEFEDEFWYCCIVTDADYNSVYSEYVRVLSPEELTIYSQPTDAMGRPGDDVSFTVGVYGGTAPYTYRWVFTFDSTDSWHDCDTDWFVGADTNCLTTTVSDDEFSENYRYFCVITDAAGNEVYSDTVKVY